MQSAKTQDAHLRGLHLTGEQTSGARAVLSGLRKTMRFSDGLKEPNYNIGLLPSPGPSRFLSSLIMVVPFRFHSLGEHCVVVLA